MNLVNQMVELIMSFIRDFLDKARLRELSEALGAKKRETTKDLSEVDKLYEEYKNDYEAYKTDMANRTLPDLTHSDEFGSPSSSKMRPSSGDLQQSGSEAETNDTRPRGRKASSRAARRRAARDNRKTKQGKPGR